MVRDPVGFQDKGFRGGEWLGRGGSGVLVVVMVVERRWT